MSMNDHNRLEPYFTICIDSVQLPSGAAPFVVQPTMAMEHAPRQANGRRDDELALMGIEAGVLSR
jgi:hypothetical protein